MARKSAVTNRRDWPRRFTGRAFAQCCRFVDLAEGATLAEEDEALKRILFICSGRAGVMIGGREVSHLGRRAASSAEVAFRPTKRQPRR
jgi:5-deoxy-D-glucuronate isomerase